ncbi:hypothetical protein ACQEVF_22210 [Nonomuraea polychroma]|uniref:hypothetical protein n=1 Tax=Nonomuraea polychroma TaxID=46176 RepID=UPI003D8FEE9B
MNHPQPPQHPQHGQPYGFSQPHPPTPQKTSSGALKAAVIGLLIGAVVLAAILFGRYVMPDLGPAGSSAAEDRPTAQRIDVVKPSYDSARAIYEKLWPTSVRCKTLQSTRTTGTESEAAECRVNGHISRISIYPSTMDVEDLLDSTNGRSVYGGRLELVAGVNWTMTIAPAYSTTEDHQAIADDAQEIAEVLGGAVMTEQ